MKEKINSIIKNIDANKPDLIPLVVYSISVIAVLLILRIIILKAVQKRQPNSITRLRWRRLSGYFSLFIAVGLILPPWLPSLKSLATFLGLFGAGILIVFKEVFLNLYGWMFIAVRKPFDLGDRIQVGESRGDVIDLRIMEFSMIEVLPPERGGQSTGRVLHIPNMLVITQPFSNASKDFSFNWNEIEIRISTNSDYRKAEKILLQAADRVIEKISPDDYRLKKAESKLAIKYNSISPGVFIEIKEKCISLTLRHLTTPRKTRILTDQIHRDILEHFSKEKNIDLA